MTAPRSPLTLAFPILAGAAALAPDDADACPQPYSCEEVPSWTFLTLYNAAKIPTDGVLVISGKRQGEGDPLANITLEVTKDGQPIAGAFETTPSPDVLIWRPADPWEPGATYHAEGAAMNPGIFEYCGLELEEIFGDFTIDTAPSGALGTPEFTSMVQKQQTQELTLESLACCEGAEPPTLDPGYCYGYYLHYADGACAPTKANGYFVLQITELPAAEGPVAKSILYTVKQDGVVLDHSLEPTDAYSSPSAPVCITVEALDLGTGAMTVSAEQCFGQDFVDELGPKTLTPELDCPLEQCAVTGNTWDKTMCTPFESGTDSDTPTSSDTTPETGEESGSDTDPTQDGDKACACAETTAPPAALLLAAPLLLTRRRRRS